MQELCKRVLAGEILEILTSDLGHSHNASSTKLGGVGGIEYLRAVNHRTIGGSLFDHWLVIEPLVALAISDY